MEEVKEPSDDSLSSSIDMKEWDLLDPDLDNLQKSTIMNETKEESEPKPVISPTGLFIHITPEHSGVEEIVTDNEPVHRCESNSSSDIDVIDECLEESQGSISVPSMDISFCSSDISSTMSASQQGNIDRHLSSRDGEIQTDEIPPNADPPAHERTFFENLVTVARLVIDAVNAFQRERSIADYIVIISVISLCVVLPVSHIVVTKASWQREKLAQMEGHIDKLQNENIHLKNKVLSKIESGKLFGELDEEMRELKEENLKLHKAMQTVIHQLEEQTHAIRKGLEVKEYKYSDSYKKEIAKLKEQINMLRIDNEELQTQLVRIRYGKHPIHEDESKKRDEGKKVIRSKFSSETAEVGEKRDNPSNRKEEINEFRKKLCDEFLKLKNWEKMLEDFMKELEGHRLKEGFKNRKYDDERNGNNKYDDGKTKQKNHKSRKFYDWSWKEIQDNFKGTIENFPAVSDMISQYVLFDKQKVDGVLNSIGHYFKKAQDKTKKILESYSVDEKTQAVKDDIWTLVGEMKKKWTTMKDDFIRVHFGSSDLDENIKPDGNKIYKNSNQEEEQMEAKGSYKSERLNENDRDSHYDEKVKKEIHTSEKINEFDKHYILNPDILSDMKENMDDMDEFNKLLKEAQQMIYDRESSLDTWMFERARHRAELREGEGVNEDSSNLNWYLRKAKLAKESEKDFKSENIQSGKKERE